MSLRLVESESDSRPAGQDLRDAYDAVKRLEVSPDLPETMRGAVRAFGELLELRVRFDREARD